MTRTVLFFFLLLKIAINSGYCFSRQTTTVVLPLCTGRKRSIELNLFSSSVGQLSSQTQCGCSDSEFQRETQRETQMHCKKSALSHQEISVVSFQSSPLNL